MSATSDIARPEATGWRPGPVPGTGLERNAVGGIEVFAQGIAAAAPSVAVAVVPAQIFLVAGAGSIWSAALGGALVLLVAYLISLHARRTVSTGSLGTYVGNGLGPGAAFATGWGLLIGYTGFAVGGLFGGVLYFSDLLHQLGIDTSSQPARLGVLAVVAAAAIILPYRGVRLSARSALIIELLSILAISIIFVATLYQFGWQIDWPQFDTQNFALNTLLIGGVLSVGSYAGFESVASLGLEARNPHRTIAKVVVRTVLLLAAVYLVATYTEVLSFSHGPNQLNPDTAPLPVVAANANVSWVVFLIDIGIGISMVAFAAAVISAGARSLFTLASEGAVPHAFARTHGKFHSPHIGVVTIGLIALTLGVIGTLSSVGRLLFETYLGIVATWGYLTSYLLIAIATPLYLKRIHALTPVSLLASLVTIAAVLFVIYNNLIPVPAWPFNVLPYAFLGLLVLGLTRYWYLLATDPARARRIGELQELSEEEVERLTTLGVHPGPAATPAQ